MHQPKKKMVFINEYIKKVQIILFYFHQTFCFDFSIINLVLVDFIVLVLFFAIVAPYTSWVLFMLVAQYLEGDRLLMDTSETKNTQLFSFSNQRPR